MKQVQYSVCQHIEREVKITWVTIILILIYAGPSQGFPHQFTSLRFKKISRKYVFLG